MGSDLNELSWRLGNTGIALRLVSLYSGSQFMKFGLIAVGFERYGSDEALEKDAIKHLYDVYVRINADADKDPEVKVEAAKWFKRMEEGEQNDNPLRSSLLTLKKGDETALTRWRTWRELSIKKYIQDYAQLNVSFDVYTGESQVGKEWQDKALERLTEMGLISDAEGAKIIDLEKWKLGKAIVRKKGKFDSRWSWGNLIEAQMEPAYT